MKISTKIIVLLAILCSCIVILGVLGSRGIDAMHDRLDSVYKDRVIPLKQIKSVSDAYAVKIVDTAHKVGDGLFTPAEGIESLLQAQKIIDDDWRAFLSTELVEAEIELTREFTQLKIQADLTSKNLLAIIQSGDITALQTFSARELYPAIDPLQETLNKLIELQLSETLTSYNQGMVEYDRDMLIMAGMIILSLISSVLAGYLITRSITNALGTEPGDAALLVKCVAEGNLSVPIEPALNSSSESLISQLKFMQESLIAITTNVNLGASEVAKASVQIAQDNHELASRTQQQASALEETAAAMEQLSATVNQNAQNASEVTQVARSAMSVARSGGSVMQNVISTMHEIDAGSQQIASILGLIDDIASQTNLLSLNAAVEAARAGDQGRGFAVVASEVRALAQRSADAAQKIKTLIDSSSESVQKGTILVSDAGLTMENLVSEVQRVTTLIDEISTASREQSDGVRQVGIAVTQIDVATQQNSLLVDQMSSATHHLSTQAKELVQTMSVFQLPGEQR